MLGKVVRGSIGAVAAIFLATSVMVVGQNDGQRVEDARTSPTHRLYACRGIGDPVQRLSCFDREVAALEQAVANKDVLIADRQDMREARRGLFGFPLPKIRLFGGGEDDDTEVERFEEIEEALTAFVRDSTGKAAFTIASGARWVQTDSVPILGKPAVGDMVKIERAALGSYKATIGDRRAIRVRRVQ